MKSFAAVLAVLLVSSPALAGRDRGGDSGGGRLGQVTSGIDRATDKPSSSSSSSSSSDDSSSSRTDDDDSCCYSGGYTSTYSGSGGSSSPAIPFPPVHVDVEASAGAQKVYESGGSLSASLAVLFNQRLRFDVRASHYFEDQMNGSRITLTLPTLTAGLRIGDLGPTKLWLEGGLAYVTTKDPAGDAAIFGSAFGATVTHAISPDTMLVANATAMLFDGVQAYAGRAGVRFHHVELAFSVLDFSVGPALYGPQVGFGF